MIAGKGLHLGQPATLTLSAWPKSTTSATALCGTPVRELRAMRADRATRVVARDRQVLTVEHLFAALAGLGLHDGVAIELEGPEVPLADGCAARFCEAARALGVAASEPRLVVKRAGQIAIGTCAYAFAPHDGVRVEVRAEWEDARLGSFAAWDGDPADFAARIAPARTFGFAHEIEALLARGLAKHVEPETVVVIAPEGLLSAGREAASDEPVRHKLLDLVGDLFLYGGPPRGIVRATRPGHFVTHEAMRRAFEEGIVARTR